MDQAGVYALTHKTTGKLYVGSTKNFKKRRERWWQTMNRNPQNLPPLMRIITQSRHDWEFKVVIPLVDPTSEQLELVEQQVVDALRQQAPARLLNLLPVARPDTAGLTAGNQTKSLNQWSRDTGIPRATIATRYQQLGWTPEQAVGLHPPPVRDYTTEHLDATFARSKVLILDGNVPLTQRQAAVRLGCRQDTLSIRLMNYRASNGTQASVQLSELLEKSKKYRKNYRKNWL